MGGKPPKCYAEHPEGGLNAPSPPSCYRGLEEGGETEEKEYSRSWCRGA